MNRLEEYGFYGDFLIDSLNTAGYWPTDLDPATKQKVLEAEHPELLVAGLALVVLVDMDDSVWYEIVQSDPESASFGIIDTEGNAYSADSFDELPGVEEYWWSERGPLWYYSNVEINRTFKGPVLFLRDGMVLANPSSPGKFSFFPWENISKFELKDGNMLVLGNEKPEVVLTATDKTAFTPISFKYALAVLAKVIPANQSIDSSGLEHPPILPWNTESIETLLSY